MPVTLPVIRRTGIHELLIVDENVREAIHAGKGELEIERLIRSNTPSIRADGLQKVLNGETTLEEVLRVTRRTIMSAFVYQALDAKGRRKEGMIEADSSPPGPTSIT